MKNIKILELTASNFKAQNFHDVYKDINYLSGKNGSGKSTRISAWLWLLSSYCSATDAPNSCLFEYVTFTFGNKANYQKYNANSDLICEFHTILLNKHIDCNMVWLKSRTNNLLDEMRDIALGQFYIVSDIEITNPMLYEKDKEYHKKINALIRARKEIYEAL